MGPGSAVRRLGLAENARGYRMHDPDPRTLQRARAGDLPAFEELVRGYQAEVFRFALHLTHDHPLAEDVTQETFLRALPFTYKGVEAPAGTIVRISITGEAGGDWSVRRAGDGWELRYESDVPPDSTVVIDQSDAWLLFTKRTDRMTARARFPSIRVEGDTDLGEAVLELVSIMA